MEIIKTIDLKKTYSTGKVEVNALRGVSFAIEKGDFVSIIGPSGSGKSTLMNLIGCLDIPTSGDIIINGTSIKENNEDELAEMRSKNIGFVFQAFNLLNKFSCLHNVETPLIYQGVEKERRLEMGRVILSKVGLKEKIDSTPLELSGGQKQRVAIARALITRPEILLADEPTGALDTHTSHEIMDLFQQLNDEGNTVIIVTHEHDIANFARTIIQIKDGLIDEITKK